MEIPQGLGNLVTELFLMSLVIFSEVRNYIERRGLLDRIMAKDLPEYNAFGSENKSKGPDKKKEPLSIRI